MELEIASRTEEYVTNTPDVSQGLRGIIETVVPAALLLVIIVLSVLGNLAVIIAVWRTPSLREKTSSIFLINLSVTDLMNASLVMPSALVSLVADGWLLGTPWCYAQCGLHYCFIVVSMLTLSIISVDGYFAVIRPLHYFNIVTSRRTKMAVSYTWLQGLVFALVPVMYTWVVYDYWEVVCAIDWDNYSHDGAQTYVTIAFVVCFLIPTCVMVFCYIKISIAASASSARQPQHSRNIGRQVSKNIKVIQSLAVVVITFFICMTPFCVTKVIKIFLSSSSLPPYIDLASSCFAFISSASNPFIYGIFRREFRQAFKKLFCRKPINPTPQRRRVPQGVELGHIVGQGRNIAGMRSSRVSTVEGQCLNENNDPFQSSSAAKGAHTDVHSNAISAFSGKKFAK